MKQLQNYHLLHHAFVFKKAWIGQTAFSVSVLRAKDTQGRKAASTPSEVIPYTMVDLSKVIEKALGFYPDSYEFIPRPPPRVDQDCFNRIVLAREKSLSALRPIIVSQLNGSNGEVTGSDDLAAINGGFGGKKTPEELDLLKRARKEAGNKIHSRSVSGDSKRSQEQVHYSNRQKNRVEPVSKPKEADAQKAVLQEETFSCYVIPSDINLYEIQGAAYSSIPGGYNVFTGCEDFVPPGEGLIGRKILVQSCGVGWFIRSSIESKNKLNYVTSTACTVLVNDGFSYRDKSDRLVHCEKKEFIIYKPLFTNFLKNVRSDVLTDFVVKQCMMVATNQAYIVDGQPSHPIILSTLEAYKYWLFRYGIMQNSGNVRKFITLNYDALGYHETQHALHEEAWISENHIQVDGKFSPWNEYSIDTENLSLSSWEPREDFEIIENVGVDVSTGRLDFGEDVRPVNRFKVTKFFSFEGLGLEPFNKHTRSNLNLSHGCKRLIGCRGSPSDESMLRHKAAALAWAMLDNTDPYEVRMFAKCTKGRETGYPLDLGLRHFIRDSFFELKSHVTPHFFSRKIGEAKTWLHTAKYSALEQWYQHNPFYGRELWAKIPHAKAKQRVEFVGNRMFHHEEYRPLTKMEVCIKDEVGKTGKPCRLFLNLDSESSYAPTLPMHTKVLLHGTHMFQLPLPGSSRVVILELFIYAQPNPQLDELDYVAQKMNEARHLEDYLFVALHSDDSVMVGNVRGRAIMCNNDISSNDSGQDAPAFFGMAVLQGRLSQRLAEGMLDLAMLPILIRSPTSDKKVKLQFNKPLEPSGHGNTSCWNHLGTMLVSLCIFYELVNSDKSVAQCAADGASYVGHVMTCEHCECIEDLQFLKFSPVLCDGKYIMSANLGRLFRRLGMVDNDLTHTQLGVDLIDFRAMTPQERMDRFWSAVMVGYKHEPSNVILDALRTRFDSSRFQVTESALALLQNDQADSYYGHSRTFKIGDCSDSMVKRYRLTSSEVDELVAVIRDLTVGQRYKLTSIAKIFSKDYGVSTVKEPQRAEAIGTHFASGKGQGRLSDAVIEHKSDD